MKTIKPLTNIEDVLEHDRSYPPCSPVILFDRSRWQKFVGIVKGAVNS